MWKKVDQNIRIGGSDCVEVTYANGGKEVFQNVNRVSVIKDGILIEQIGGGKLTVHDVVSYSEA